MIENLQAEDIDATLRGGQIFASKAWRAFFVTMYVLMGICLGGFIFLLILSLSFPSEFDRDDVLGALGGIGFSIALLLVFIFLSKYFNRGKKKVKLWLQDAVLLKAKTKSIGERLLVRSVGVMRKGVAIEVEFFYNDIRYKRQSEYKGKPVYLPVYGKYANQVISVAYSPQHDEVMLIKPKSLEKYRDSQKTTEEETNA